jgi:quercetin dioxygenase-like cupin family protein
MDVKHIDDFTNGWFIGDFEPSLFKNPFFEVAHQHHLKGKIGDKHLHKLTTEVTYIVKGSMVIKDKQLGRDRTLSAGHMFTFFPNEISDVIFLEDSDLIVVRWPSIPSDKYMVD